jgi:hypothetical protein
MRIIPPLADDPERQLTLRQADQARADFAAIESNLEFLMDQLARLPTCRALARSGWHRASLQPVSIDRVR